MVPRGCSNVTRLVTGANTGAKTLDIERVCVVGGVKQISLQSLRVLFLRILYPIAFESVGCFLVERGLDLRASRKLRSSGLAS